jgi:DNA-binding transcriptional regulator YiaG
MKKANTKISWKPGEKLPPSQTNVNKLKRMSDKDNKPLTKKELLQFKPIHTPKRIDVKNIREKLRISQEEFARYFGVNVRTIQDWEQHRHAPGRTARNFLTVIAREPRAVQRALQKGWSTMNDEDNRQ